MILHCTPIAGNPLTDDDLHSPARQRWRHVLLRHPRLHELVGSPVVDLLAALAEHDELLAALADLMREELTEVVHAELRRAIELERGPS